MQSAVVDRIVDGSTAVLLIGQKQTQFLCSVEELPVGVKDGQWLMVKIADGRLLEAQIDLEKTQEMKERIGAKLNLLRKRNPRRR